MTTLPNRLRRALLSLLPAGVAGAALPAAAAATAPADPFAPQPYVRLQTPAWARDAVIYQLNLRQFSAAGSLAAAELALPRLRALGIDVVWLMPIHPIGAKNRKGGLGSPYSVRDYRAVAPEYGTLDDLRRFVRRAHDLGMRVILDWVANHSAWDNPLVEQHPEWYERDWKGDFHPTSWWDWSDIIEFDYAQPGLRRWMTESLEYWVREADVDGYRCDVAGYVPLDFWETARARLERIKPVLMLAEWEATDLHARAFDMSYAWSWYEAMHRVAQGKATADALRLYYSAQDNAWPREALRMTFVSNHDKNSWEGTEFEAFGPALEAAMVLSVVGAGLPLVYNGQEAGNPKRLQFFEKDPIQWREHPNGELYRRLFALRKSHRALWSGAWGGRMLPVPADHPDKVLAFVRRQDGDEVFAAFNFSATPLESRFPAALCHGAWHEPFAGRDVAVDAAGPLALPAWGWRVFVRPA